MLTRRTRTPSERLVDWVASSNGRAAVSHTAGTGINAQAIHFLFLPTTVSNLMGFIRELILPKIIDDGNKTGHLWDTKLQSNVSSPFMARKSSKLSSLYTFANVWGLGFGVWGLGFGVWGLGFGVW